MPALHLSSIYRQPSLQAVLRRAAIALSFTVVLATPGVSFAAAPRPFSTPSLRAPTDDTKHRPRTRRRARRETRAAAAIHFETPASELELVSDLHQLMIEPRAQWNVGRRGAFAQPQRHALHRESRRAAAARVEHEAVHDRARARPVRGRAPVQHRRAPRRRARRRRRGARQSHHPWRRRSCAVEAFHHGQWRRDGCARAARRERGSQARHRYAHRRRQRVRHAAHPRGLEDALSAVRLRGAHLRALAQRKSRDHSREAGERKDGRRRHARSRDHASGLIERAHDSPAAAPASARTRRPRASSK